MLCRVLRDACHAAGHIAAGQCHAGATTYSRDTTYDLTLHDTADEPNLCGMCVSALRFNCWICTCASNPQPGMTPGAGFFFN